MPISYRAAQNLIKRGNEAGLRAALNEALDPNLANENGWTLLMLAAVEGQAAIARLLIEHGADLAKHNTRGQTAHAIALSRGNAAFADLLNTPTQEEPGPPSPS